jgi:hypothetical protein
MPTHTCRRPDDRLSLVHKQLDAILPDINAHAGNFGLHIGGGSGELKAISLLGRVLDVPMMQYARSDRPERPSGGKWNMRNK